MDILGLAALYEAGWTTKELGEVLGCSPGTIRYHLNKAPGFEMRNRRHRQDEKPRMARRRWRSARLYRNGHSLRAIAAKLGCAPRTVLNDLIAAGVERRPAPCRANPNPLTDEQREQIARYIALHKAGWTNAQIARAAGVGYSAIQKRMRRVGYKPGNGKNTQPPDTPALRARREKAAHLYLKGERIGFIAFNLGVSEDTVNRDLWIMGIERNRHRRRAHPWQQPFGNQDDGDSIED